MDVMKALKPQIERERRAEKIRASARQELDKAMEPERAKLRANLALWCEGVDDEARERLEQHAHRIARVDKPGAWREQFKALDAVEILAAEHEPVPEANGPTFGQVIAIHRTAVKGGRERAVNAVAHWAMGVARPPSLPSIEQAPPVKLADVYDIKKDTVRGKKGRWEKRLQVVRK